MAFSGLLRTQIHFGILDPAITAHVGPFIGGLFLILAGLSLALLGRGALKARRT